ncbi:hypothetical protein Tco_0164596 [Tanacetum coccineum]
MCVQPASFMCMNSSLYTKLSSRGSTSVADMYQTFSSGSKLSPCSQYWLWIRCIALCLLNRLAAPYLLRRLVTPYLLMRLVASYLLRRLAAPYLLRRLAASYLLRRLAAPYLLRRRYSLVIASGPEVAFVTPAIPVDRSNMEWLCLRTIRS